MVELFDVIKFPGSVEDLPAPTVPYYFTAKEGFYLFKQTALGPVFLPEKKMPDHFESLGDRYKNGFFHYTASLVPEAIISQALDFFRQVYDSIKAEAEVL